MLCHTLEKCLQKLEAEVDSKHKRNNEVGVPQKIPHKPVRRINNCVMACNKCPSRTKFLNLIYPDFYLDLPKGVLVFSKINFMTTGV